MPGPKFRVALTALAATALMTSAGFAVEKPKMLISTQN